MEKKDSHVSTAKDWGITNLDGKLIMQFLTGSFTQRVWDKQDQRYENKTSYRVKVFFNETNSYFYYSSTPLGMGSKSVVKKLWKNELISDGDLDWEMAKRLISNNKGRIGQMPKPEVSDEISVDDGIIYQGGIKVGSVIRSETDDDYTFAIYNIDSEKVVTAVVAITDPVEWNLFREDGTKKSYLYNDDPLGHKMISYLIKKRYLFVR